MAELQGKPFREAKEDVQEAYELLIHTLCWERNRILEYARLLAAGHTEEKAIDMLRAHAAYIREQADR